MPYTTTVQIGAGSSLFYESTVTPGTYIALPEALSVGETGEEGDFIQSTAMAETTHEFVQGLKTPPQKTIVMRHKPGDAAYRTFWDHWEATDRINMRIIFRTGDQADFVMIPNGTKMSDPNATEVLKLSFFGQQSGDTVWSESA